MSNEIEKVIQPGFLAPAVAVQDALQAYQAKKDLIEGIMREGVDYGTIPGTTKPTLLKPGAEKATSFFGLAARFKDAKVIEDFTGQDHNGEPFFYYRRTCELWHGDYLIAAVDGSCNSFEKKYRYRSSERTCPNCGKPTIIKGKAEYGGGWLCYAKKGGCGKKYDDNDPAIVAQETGTILNPDIADLANTILKMADKRALIAATLIATGMSEYFTQDLDDFVQGEIIESKVAPVQPENINQDTGEINAPIQLINPMSQAAVSEAAAFWNISKADAAKEIAKLNLGKQIDKREFLTIIQGHNK